MNIPNYYHISKGAYSIYYILNNGEDFIKNLSTDLKQAKQIAKEIVGSDVPVNIWCRKSWNIDNKKYLESLVQLDQHIEDHKSHLDSLEIAKRQKEIEAKYSKFSHLGKVGEQITLELTITKIFKYVGDYGLTFVHKFEDTNGNQVIYFGHSKQLVDEKAQTRFQEGNKITITGIVKDHSKDRDDRNMPLTVITKPKITKGRENENKSW